MGSDVQEWKSLKQTNKNKQTIKKNQPTPEIQLIILVKKMKQYKAARMLTTMIQNYNNLNIYLVFLVFCEKSGNCIWIFNLLIISTFQKKIIPVTLQWIRH